ncbi:MULTISPECIES: hypothetical protein [Pseudothermotoga]|jgi:tartrate dehydratase beta subunit/fumarate hydratase class I family protein|uniref:Uncharacterized protein n=1 Tax=Pseudothermotoga lettingae (strain ATCC BAA-301 / DSM 14385 / NBRC 107922 / TMO) TaxID=416591 RepID=A8F6X8_PSELT|nr:MULTISPECIES: hypothetical protein [Pseudothermotoga]ABV33912.1 conserved hypothetical protein [Pseudothermotoga lettingae TMO]KUK20442.1 MAG: Uncharacterized protein XD56_1650 [Pseudothermotoga lettingae]MDI3494178.1 hypothetical protein [Pseudothermotoga sp.]MDK2884257.1 hypothetical protein [Pseudothermotoga sp.]GLI49151.1 hypothetical protein PLETTINGATMO_13200 [Pseudothermotoga lettingae TMO]
MLVIRYPASLNVIRKLKTSDIVKYTGKLTVLSRQALERIIFYERAEGLIPDFMNGELICFGSIKEGFLNILSARDFEDLFEKIFLFGSVGIISKANSANPFYFKRYGRVMFTAMEKPVAKSFKILAYSDLKSNAVMEVEVEDLLMRVTIDSRGTTKHVEVE